MIKKFTLIEVLVCIAIISILCAMIFPAIETAKDANLYHKLITQYGSTICGKQEMVNILHLKNEDGTYSDYPDEAKAKKEELEKICEGTKKLEQSEYFSGWIKRKEEFLNNLKVVENNSDPKYIDIYNSWIKRTRRRNISYDEFAVLYSKGLIKEYQYKEWVLSTGNKKELTEEQYNALLENGFIILE